MKKTVVPYLLANAALFAVLGLVTLVAPTAFARALEMTVESATAVADFRAVYGGVCIWVTALSVLAVRREALRPGAVLALVLLLDGAIFGRLLSWATHGPGSVLVFAQLGLEVVGATWGVLLLRSRASFIQSER